jgi:hypothetical protein
MPAGRKKTFCCFVVWPINCHSESEKLPQVFAHSCKLLQVKSRRRLLEISAQGYGYLSLSLVHYFMKSSKAIGVSGLGNLTLVFSEPILGQITSDYEGT